jgi:hypothetical protein
MKRNPNTTSLTKDYIESKVSQELILSRYLGIDIDVIKNCIEHNVLIKSVFRDNDENKSMGFQYNNKGKLKVRDFGGFGFFDDVYGTVAYVLSIIYNRTIDTNNKKDFYFVLKHIAYTFSDIIDGKDVDPNVENLINEAIVKTRSAKPIIDIVTRSWNNEDSKVWNKWRISLNYLNTHFVYPVDQYYINRGIDSEPKYKYSYKDPCYAYYLGTTNKGINNIKLYFPLRDRHKELKFITNSNCLEGLPNLELFDYDIILITKSSKDRLAIGNHLFNHPLYGGGLKVKIGIINLPSENYLLKDVEYNYLNERMALDGVILSLLDFDTTGRKGARYLKETYGINYIFITRGEFGLNNFNAKDFAELEEHYSAEVIEEFVRETFQYINLKYRYYENVTF